MQTSYFAKNLKFLRKERKLSLENLSEAIEISKSAISDYENDKFSPSLSVCRRIAIFFEITIDMIEFSDISENSISERTNSNFQQTESSRENADALQAQLTEKSITLRLHQQKIEALQTQLRLQDLLRDGKLSEIELLKTQIRLLEETNNILKAQKT